MLLKGPRQWITSPLGFNILLASFNDSNVPKVEKYRQITKLLKNKKGSTIETKLFISSSCKSKEQNIKKLLNVSDTKEADFNKNGNAFMDWVKNWGSFKTDFDLKTELVLANICKFEGDWQSCESSGPIMKLYNSFNYTQDIKYEARLLELPLQSDLKLVVVVPNEADVLRTLFSTLLNEGLTAAVNSIQPLFTYTSDLKAPSIEVSSKVQIEKSLCGLNASTFQYGGISVNEKGTQVNVLTCIYSPKIPVVTKEELPSEPPFYFAVVFNDLPIFTGQFTQR